jgi:hypothetical protein
MNIATLCNTYQKKMWKSMISRKDLQFSIWDVIATMNEKIYYMPYSGYMKFEVTTQHCRKCGTELSVGFRKNQFITNTCKCSNDNKNHATIEKLTTLFNVDTAKEIINQFSARKTRNLPNQTQKWISLGYTEAEALQMVKEVQTQRSAKSPSTQPGVREYSVRCAEYWIKKGYSVEDSQLKVSESQVGNGIDWYISRYGKVEGQIRFDERIKKWLTSYNLALENDPTIAERKAVKLGRASAASLKVFRPIYDKYKDKFKIYLGVDDNVEYFLRADKTLFFYDFTIPELKLIVEFNGSAWHPNTALLSPTQLQEWTGIFTETTADAILAKDYAKKKVAESYGYTVIVIWDTDEVSESINKIEKIIEGNRGY